MVSLDLVCPAFLVSVKETSCSLQSIRQYFRNIQYEDTILISTYSPHRAEKDKADRDRLIEKLKKKLGDVHDEASVKRVISNSGYKKFMNVGKDSTLTLNQDAIDADALWDGYHGIAVSNNANLSITDALAHYKELWRVEEAFRVAKCTLKTRPIFHRTLHRIKSHVLLCFMNLFLERFLEFLLREKKTHLHQTEFVMLFWVCILYFLLKT